MAGSEIYINVPGRFSGTKGLKKVYPVREVEMRGRSDLERASIQMANLRGKPGGSKINAILCPGQDKEGAEDFTVYPTDPEVKSFKIEVGHFDYPNIVKKVESKLNPNGKVIIEIQ